MKNIRQLTTIAGAMALVATLSACGGGGDDGVATGTPPPGPVAVGDATDLYVGSWKSDCFEADDVSFAAAPDEQLTGTVTFTLAKASATRLSMTVTQQYYRANAVACSGAPIATHTNSSATNSVVIDGTATIGARTADKVTFTTGAIGGISAGQTITINGVVYPGNFFTRTNAYKDLFQITGTTLRWGNDAVLDAQGYPTTLVDDFKFTKQ